MHDHANRGGNVDVRVIARGSLSRLRGTERRFRCVQICKRNREPISAERDGSVAAAGIKGVELEDDRKFINFRWKRDFRLEICNSERVSKVARSGTLYVIYVNPNVNLKFKWEETVLIYDREENGVTLYGISQ